MFKSGLLIDTFIHIHISVIILNKKTKTKTKTTYAILFLVSTISFNSRFFIIRMMRKTLLISKKYYYSIIVLTTYLHVFRFFKNVKNEKMNLTKKSYNRCFILPYF